MHDINLIQIILVTLVAFVAGMASVLDERQFHRPLVACTLTGIALGLLGVLNLVVIIRLAPWVIGALRDFESQRARGITEPAFVGHGNSLLPGDVVPGVWEPDDAARRG